MNAFTTATGDAAVTERHDGRGRQERRAGVNDGVASGNGDFAVHRELMRDLVSSNSSAGEIEQAGPDLGNPALTRLLSQLADRFSAEEVAALVDQRQNLMHKSFESTLSLDESKQLAVLEWQLDQLELAKGGESEEGLSKFMTRLEAISQYVNGMADTLKERRESSRDRHGRRR